MPTKSKTVLAITLAFVSAGSHAQSYTVNWVGINNNFGDLPVNWSTGVVPGSTDDVLLRRFNTVFRSGSVNVSSFLGTGQLSLLVKLYKQQQIRQ
ncbi:MAG: hypothetical protein WC782_10030 [Methylococcaceae bacterium]|jgi:hypothetical protein